MSQHEHPFYLLLEEKRINYQPSHLIAIHDWWALAKLHEEHDQVCFAE